MKHKIILSLVISIFFISFILIGCNNSNDNEKGYTITVDYGEKTENVAIGTDVNDLHEVYGCMSLVRADIHGINPESNILLINLRGNKDYIKEIYIFIDEKLAKKVPLSELKKEDISTINVEMKKGQKIEIAVLRTDERLCARGSPIIA